LALVHQF